MGRLVRIEFLKLKHHRATWVLLGLYLLCILAVAFGAGLFLSYLADQGVAYRGIDPTILPIYDFVDIWQNLAYMAYLFKVFPAFLLIISISNEYTYKTHRQNIIDGMSRTDFFLSKLSFAAFLAIVSGVFLFLVGLLLGFINSPVTDIATIFGHLHFILAHIFQLFTYFLFAILLVLLIRRSGITIVVLLMYSVILEPVAAGIINYRFEVNPSFLPLQAISDVVPMPFAKYIFQYSPDFIAPLDFTFALGWGIVFTALIFWILKKRDF